MIPLKDNVRSKKFPIVNWLLILANFYAFYLELRMHNPRALETFITQWSVTPKYLFNDFSGHWYTLITAMFLHGGWMHIIFNMLFLYVFGDNVEDMMGHFRYLYFYLIVGILANGVQAYLSPSSMIPLIGASGAIAGVLGSYFFYYPHSRVLTLIPIGIFITIKEIPAYFLLGIWFVIQAFSGFMVSSVARASGHVVSDIAWWAHVVGFVSGLVLSPAFGGLKSKRRS